MTPSSKFSSEDRFSEPERNSKEQWCWPAGCFFDLAVGVVVGVFYGFWFGLLAFLLLFVLVTLSVLFIDTLRSDKARQLLAAESGVGRVEGMHFFSDRIFGLSSRGTELIYWQSGQPPSLFRSSEIKRVLVCRMWQPEVEDLSNIEWEVRRHPINDLDENNYSISYSVYSFEHFELGEVARLYVDYESGYEQMYKFLLSHFQEEQLYEVDEFPS